MDPEVARIIGEIRDELKALRVELVRKDVCDGKHRLDALRLDTVEKATSDQATALATLENRVDSSRQSTRQVVGNVVAVIVAALIGAIGAYMAARAGVK